MIIDCGSCTVRGQACTDCVVTFLTIPVRSGASHPHPARVSTSEAHPGSPSHPEALDLDDAERGALDVLARSGLVPPLRMAQGR